MNSRVTGHLAMMALVLAPLIWLPACKTAGPGTGGHSAPAYTRAAENFRHFDTADELSAYLRYASDAGPLISAHRGAPMPGFPENCIETFDRVLRVAPALIEVDVRMTSDSVLILMHDEDVGRTSNGQGRVSDMALRELRTVLLRDPSGIITPFRVPTLAETLAWSRSKAVLALDVKPGTSRDMVADEIRRHRASNRVVVIVYSIPDLMAFASVAPELNYSVPAESSADFDAIMNAGIDEDQIILWTGIGEVRQDLIRRAHARGIRLMMGTFGEIDERARQAGAAVYEQLLQSGIDVIATDRVVEVAEAIERVSVFSEP